MPSNLYEQLMYPNISPTFPTLDYVTFLLLLMRYAAQLLWHNVSEFIINIAIILIQRRWQRILTIGAFSSITCISWKSIAVDLWRSDFSKTDENVAQTIYTNEDQRVSVFTNICKVIVTIFGAGCCCGGSGEGVE